MSRVPIEFFKTPNGHEPVREWLFTLERNERKLLGARIMWVQEHWPISNEYVKFVTGSHQKPALYEIRQNADQKIFRVFFYFEHGKMILVHGIQKKNEVEGARGIAVARKRIHEAQR